jgi:hypothetical protein
MAILDVRLEQSIVGRRRTQRGATAHQNFVAIRDRQVVALFSFVYYY